jgi:hypothetical protein
VDFVLLLVSLIEDMDKNGVDIALVKARAGYVSNDMVARAASHHPGCMIPLARVGHDQQSAGYLDDPAPVREAAPAEFERCLSTLGIVRAGDIEE